MKVETPRVDCLHLRQIRKNFMTNVDGPIHVGSTHLHNYTNFKIQIEGPINMVDVIFFFFFLKKKMVDVTFFL
jgi:hypothetical protein